MGLEIKQRWYAVPPGQIYPVWYEPGAEVPDGLADLAVELGLDKEAVNVVQTDTSIPALTAGSSPNGTNELAEVSTPTAAGEEGPPVAVTLEVRHVGAGKYGVFRGADRLTAEPMTKPEADAERLRLEAAEIIGGGRSAENGTDGAENGENAAGGDAPGTDGPSDTTTTS